MISPIDNQQWTTADLTGNGQFMDFGGGVLYVVSNRLVDNTFKIFKSLDNGATFSAVASYSFSGGDSAQFDPALTQWGTVLHIIGTMSNPADPTLVDMVTFTHETSTDTLSAPTTLITGSRIHSGYDVVLLADQTHVIVTAVTDSVSPLITGYALQSILLNPDDSVGSITTIGSVTTDRSGDTYGAISLASDGTTVELYYTSHQKRVTFGTIPQKLCYRLWTTGVWSSETVLKDYVSNYVDDKLTVVATGVGTDRLMSHLYYKQVKGKLSTVMVVGRRDFGVWKFVEYAGNETQTYLEPTLSVDTSQGFRLAYLVGDANLGRGGFLRVSSLDMETLHLTPIHGPFNTLSFRWLRGSKGFVDSATSRWAVIGERAVTVSGVITGYTPVYVSQYNLPPVVFLVVQTQSGPIAPTADITRQILLHLDASGTYDPDLDAMSFTWSLIGAPVGVVLRPVPGWPSKIDVWVPNSVGPTAQTFTVHLSVQDLDGAGAPINTADTADATLTIPLNHAPTITWVSNNITVTRNSAIVLQPTITDAETDPLTFHWVQTSGPTLAIEGDTVSSFLIILTNGVNVLGDTAVFQLTVSDGINTPVSSSITVNVASINMAHLDQRFLSRSIFTSIGSEPSPIRTRNNPTAQSGWSNVQIGAVATEFFRARYSRVALTGHRRQIYIAPRSVTVLGQESPAETYYRRIYLPGNDRGTIRDAILTESDQIMVLTEANKLYRYTPADIGVMNLTDIWQDGVDIAPYLRSGTVKGFSSSVPYNGHRVLAFITNNGLLLLQINDVTFKLEGALYLSTYDFNLYGGDDILFIRFKGVENLRRGKLLVGSATPRTDLTIDSSLEYFETVFDLDLRAVLNVWDRTNRINRSVETGEMLDSVALQYSGVLQAPALTLWSGV